MNKSFLKQLTKLHIKECFLKIPSVLIVTVLTLSVFLISMAGALASDGGKQKITIGLVGEIDETFLGIGISALTELDVTRFSVDFEPMEEAVATERLKKHEIAGFVRFPDGFIDGILTGENLQAEYVTLSGPQGLGTAVSNEVAAMVSDLVTETQAGIYGMNQYSYRYNLTDNLQKNTDELNLRYITFALNRRDMFDFQNLGVSDGLSMGGYYIAAAIAFLLLSWGISCTGILKQNRIPMSRMLAMRNVPMVYIVGAEYAGFLAVTAATVLGFSLITGILCNFTDFGIRELSGADVLSCISFFVKILPAVLMFTLLSKLMWEIFPSVVSSVLAQLIMVLGTGYLSGYFYPDSFFPDGVRTVMKLLPSGTGFSYIRHVLAGSFSLEAFILCLLYAVGGFVLILTIRQKRMAGDDR